MKDWSLGQYSWVSNGLGFYAAVRWKIEKWVAQASSFHPLSDA